MADALEVLIADAIAAELNDPTQDWASLFAAEPTVAKRSWSPWYEANDLKKLQCAVVPLTLERTRIGRAVRQLEYGFAIDLQVAVDPKKDDRIKALSLAAQQIHEWFDNADGDVVPLDIDGVANFIPIMAERKDIYDLQCLYRNRVWETMITVTVRGTKR